MHMHARPSPTREPSPGRHCVVARAAHTSHPPRTDRAEVHIRALSRAGARTLGRCWRAPTAHQSTLHTYTHRELWGNRRAQLISHTRSHTASRHRCPMRAPPSCASVPWGDLSLLRCNPKQHGHIQLSIEPCPCPPPYARYAHASRRHRHRLTLLTAATMGARGLRRSPSVPALHIFAASLPMSSASVCCALVNVASGTFFLKAFWKPLRSCTRSSESSPSSVRGDASCHTLSRPRRNSSTAAAPPPPPPPPPPPCDSPPPPADASPFPPAPALRDAPRFLGRRRLCGAPSSSSLPPPPSPQPSPDKL